MPHVKLRSRTSHMSTLTTREIKYGRSTGMCMARPGMHPPRSHGTHAHAHTSNATGKPRHMDRGIRVQRPRQYTQSAEGSRPLLYNSYAYYAHPDLSYRSTRTAHGTHGTCTGHELRVTEMESPHARCILFPPTHPNELRCVQCCCDQGGRETRTRGLITTACCSHSDRYTHDIILAMYARGKTRHEPRGTNMEQRNRADKY